MFIVNKGLNLFHVFFGKTNESKIGSFGGRYSVWGTPAKENLTEDVE